MNSEPASQTSVAPHPAVAHVVLVAVAMLALGGSLWAALGGAECSACGEPLALTGGIPLGWLGVAFYAALAVGAALPKTRAAARYGFFIAAGVHSVLLIALARVGILCPACILTGIAALMGSGFILATRPRLIWPALSWIVAGAALTTTGTAVTRQWRQARVEHAVDRPVAGQPTVSRGHVRLVVYEREGCYYCQQLESQVIPKLREELGEKLEIERREFGGSVQAPTIVVIGTEKKRILMDLPGLEAIRAAVREVMVSE